MATVLDANVTVDRRQLSTASTAPTMASAAGQSPGGAGEAAVPCKLDLLLPTGQRKTWSFPPTSSVIAVKETVWQEWPSDWPQRPPHPSALRLLYLGRFLGDQPALNSPSVNLPVTPPGSRPTVVHLVLRPDWQEHQPVDDDESMKKGANDTVPCSCQCTIC